MGHLKYYNWKTQTVPTLRLQMFHCLRLRELRELSNIQNYKNYTVKEYPDTFFNIFEYVKYQRIRLI